MRSLFLCLIASVPLAACAKPPQGATAGTCLDVILTGTQGGPPAVNGLAGAGTLVRYGQTDNDCGDVTLQFDAGRGTTERLSQLGLSPNDLDAIFLTHVHSDHTEGLAGLLQLRWHFFGGPVAIVCADDVSTTRPPPKRTISCRGLVEHTGDAFLHAGEIAQRHAENDARDPAGPATLARLSLVAVPLPDEPGTVVWESGAVTVSAIGTVHIAGSLAYRVDTPAGSVVIGGDAGNSRSEPRREASTSETVEALAKGADVLVHSVIHPVFAPGEGSAFPAHVYQRQSSARDLGAMAERAGVGHLMLTHFIPAVSAAGHGPYAVPGMPLSFEDYREAARAGGFSGEIHAGGDLTKLRLDSE